MGRKVSVFVKLNVLFGIHYTLIVYHFTEYIRLRIPSKKYVYLQLYTT